MSAGGGSANKKILDWTQLNTTESLIKLFEDHEMSSIDPDFGFCVGIHSDSNIKTAHDKVSDLNLANQSITLGTIFAGITDKYKKLMDNQWLKVWLTEKFISTYGESIIMDVYAKYRHLLGKDIDALQALQALHAHVLSTGITISFDMHGELNIQPDGTNVYKNVSEILGGTLPKSSLLYNPLIFDKTVRTKSYEEIMEEQRQITIIDLQNFINKRDECRNMVYEIGNKISEHHRKISVLQNSLNENASQVNASASQVIDQANSIVEQANSIVEHISANNGIELPPQNGIELPPQIALTPDFSPEQELEDLTNNVILLYDGLGKKITKLDELVKDVKDTYISLRSILYYNLLNTQEALGKLDQTLFSGTNEENGGLGIVLTLGKNKVVTDCVRYYLQKTFDPNITFDNNGLKFTKNGPEVDAYNPSEAMHYNVWNIFRNSKRANYPSFAWLFMMYCVLHNPANQGAHLPHEAIKVLTMTLFDDCTHSASDNIISEILRTTYKEGNTTDIKSELLYKFLETLGIEYSLNLLHCMGKPSTESIEVFKDKVKYFVGTYIAEENRMAFDRRITEIGDTQTLGSQESMPSQIDYFNNEVAALSQMTQTLSQMTQTLSQNDGHSPHFSPHSPHYSPNYSQHFSPNSPHSESNFGNSQGSNYSDLFNSYNPDDKGSQNSNKFVVLDGSSDDENEIPFGQPNEPIVNPGKIRSRSRSRSRDKKSRSRSRSRSRDKNRDKNRDKKGSRGRSRNVDKKGSRGRSRSRSRGRGIKGGRKTRRPKKNKRTRRTKDRAKYTRKR